MEPTDLAQDIDTATQAWLDIQADLDAYDGPETVMLSTGYADVWADGDVTAHGYVLFNVADW